MTRWLAAGLLFLGWHFATTFFVPAGTHRAGRVVWPFGRDSQPMLAALRPLAPRNVPDEPAPTLALGLAGTASLAFLVALGALLGIGIPAGWWPAAVVVGSLSSAALFAVYLGRWALIPLLVDSVLLWGVLVRGWDVLSLANG